MTKEVTAATVADKIVDKTASVADKAIDHAGDFVSAAADKASNIFEAASNIISAAVDQYGAQAVDAVLWVVRIDALQILITWWLAAGFALGTIYFIVTGFTRRKWQERISNVGGDVLIHFPIIVAALAATVVLFHSFPRITNVWTYTAVVKPELYLAKQAVDIVKAKITGVSPAQR